MHEQKPNVGPHGGLGGPETNVGPHGGLGGPETNVGPHGGLGSPEESVVVEETESVEVIEG